METTIHIKTDTKTRDQAKRIADSFGFTLSALVNALLKQVNRTKQLHLDLSDETPTQWMIDAMQQSEEDVKAGRVLSFKSPGEAASYFRRRIKDDEARSQRTTR